ncbi:hypothetical protein [Ferruginibacter albus]|uniref:hypothetical protein n=1 Tax=Ferruginibacter albus TaxID=2875540 RepID=UPI001CC6C9C2|nr:hypothetical protein [Ferruginibacter albus]UAY50770.1 hypothetical protein K9M53_09215 [Ferruginibacter albus]
MKKIFHKKAVHVLIGGILLFLFVSSVGIEVVPLNFFLRKNIRLLLPQGWAFFTRKANTTIKDVYVWKNGHFDKITFKEADAANDFGFSRKGKEIRTEITAILGKIPDSTWKITYNPNALLLANNLYSINNKAYLPITKGDTCLIVLHDPVSFNDRNNSVIQYKYAQVIIN